MSYPEKSAEKPLLIDPSVPYKADNEKKLEDYLFYNGFSVVAHHIPFSPSFVFFSRKRTTNNGFFICGFDNNPLNVYDACRRAIDAFNFEYSSYEDWLEEQQMEDNTENEDYYDSMKDLAKLVGAFFTLDELDKIYELTT